MSKTADLVETLVGHWGQGEFIVVERDEDTREMRDVHYCVLGAAGAAWHDDAQWFENCDDWTLDDLEDQVEYVEQVEEDWEWAKGFADYLCQEYAERLAMDFPPSGRSTLDGYRDGTFNPFTLIIRWNDGIADDEDEVVAALRGYERSKA